jgi:TMEM199 family protein
VAALHSIGDTDETDFLTPSLVVNIFFSIILCGFSTYWALTHFQTPMLLSFASAKPSAGTSIRTAEPTFVLISIFVGLLVGVAEVVVYASYLRKVAQARSREQAVKEEKVVVGEVSADTTRAAATNKTLENNNEQDGEAEEIWGRGVNGGFKRRVRERWRERRGIDK